LTDSLKLNKSWPQVFGLASQILAAGDGP